MDLRTILQRNLNDARVMLEQNIRNRDGSERATKEFAYNVEQNRALIAEIEEALGNLK